MPVSALDNGFSSMTTATKANGERVPLGIWCGKTEDSSHSVLVFNPKNLKRLEKLRL